MKKLTAFFATMTLCFALIGVAGLVWMPKTSTRVYAAEDTVGTPATGNEEEQQPDDGGEVEAPDTGDTTEFPCKVVLDNIQYGDVIIDKTEGNIGDIVTVYAKPYSLFGLKSLTVNGTALVANEDGSYTFAMVEGENLVSAVFEVNQDEIKYILSLVDTVKNGKFEDLFTLKNLIMLISWAISLFMGSGFCVTLLKSKKIKAQTAQEISTAVQTATETEVSKGINTFLAEKFGPSFDELSKSLTDITATCQSMARCMVLSQENTPEARLAIIQELSANSKKAETLADEVKKIVHAEIETNKQAEQDKLDMIKELEKKNNSLGNATIEPQTENVEGRY
nr:MAG TPA: hypothetical protein [Bacteriophage sp.]